MTISRPRWLITTALVVALLATAGGFLLGRQTGAPADDSPEAGFARDMATHHAQAVEMSMLALQRTKRDDLRTMALDMGLTQQAQIGMMRGWLDLWDLSLTSTGPAMAWMTGGTAMNHDTMTDGPALMPGMATSQEMATLRTLRDTTFDSYFINLMVRHHTGGIQMVDGVLARNPTSIVRDLAISIKRGQQSEISALEQIKTSLSGKP